MVVSGILITVAGILISIVIILLTALIFPTLFHSFGSLTEALKDATPQMGGDGTNFLLPVLVNAFIGNVSTGSFFSIIMPFGQGVKKRGASTS